MEKNDCLRDYSFLFVGFYLPEKEFARLCESDPFPQYAAQGYQRLLIDTLMHGGSSEVSVLSSVPISTYPKNRKLFLLGKKFQSNNVEVQVNPAINIFPLNFMFRFLFSFARSFFWLLKKTRKKKVVFVYALHTPHILASCILKLILGVTLVVYIPDIPKFMNPGRAIGKFKTLAKAIDARLIKFLVGCFDLKIYINKNMSDFYGVEKSIVIDSFYSQESIPEKKYRSLPEGKNFFYGGALTKEYGVKKLLEFFSGDFCQKNGINLILCGRGEMEGECLAFSNKYKNIYYWGVLGNEEVLDIQRKCFALVNLRDNSSEYNRYCFPSKISEYVKSGVPIITTESDGFPSDLSSYMNFVEGEDVRQMVSSLLADYDFYKRRSVEGKLFFQESRSMSGQAYKICEAIKEWSKK